MQQTGSQRHKQALLWLGIPAALFALTLVTAGSFFETNDDAVMALLLRGVLAGEPVSDLQYYLHGISNLLAWLYAAIPGLPWYGLLLYELLFLSSFLAAVFLSKLWKSNPVPPAHLLVFTAVLFLGAWLEHIMLTGFVRVAIVLAGTSLLAFAVASRNKFSIVWLLVCSAVFLLAICLRPRAAMLGVAAALPALWWLLQDRGKLYKPALLRMLPLVLIALAFQLFFIDLHIIRRKRTEADKPAKVDAQRLRTLPASAR